MFKTKYVHSPLPYCDFKKNQNNKKVGYKIDDMDEEGGLLNKRIIYEEFKRQFSLSKYVRKIFVFPLYTVINYN